MTSPIETNNVVERLIEAALILRAKGYSEHADAADQAASDRQSLSDRIDVLRDALERIALGEVGGDPAEPFSGYMGARKIALETVKADFSTSLTQGGKNV